MPLDRAKPREATEMAGVALGVDPDSQVQKTQ